MKKVILLMAMICVIPMFLCKDAQAAGWYTCDIGMVGSGGDAVYIMLTDSAGSFTSRPFTAYPARAKEILATAMFAKINSRQVSVYLTGTDNYSTIFSIYSY